ncbi:hypothetical protein OCC_13750 [Thermococcus litoralis DSM 5473]|uniref:Histone deacetylase domain-containing protein n=1 Tax=Thermococcus litoralis (strain ATCC 51850 / DSM 5473 / JCM 8560 / NS-C) TaxID=523849 RepID=S5ZTN5_THELN|nr:hypothetical protein OCC_13750 [Thermococcus litoralis DSM 5473]
MEILYSEVFKEHKPLRYHPENPERLELAIEGLRESDLWRNVREPPEAEVEELLRVHSEEYVERIIELSKRASPLLTPTPMYLQPLGKLLLRLLGQLLKQLGLLSKGKTFILLLLGHQVITPVGGAEHSTHQLSASVSLTTPLEPPLRLKMLLEMQL